ncbi:hypothetical protein B0H14DRAFT_2647749 [Mycena olivaceomarginata]|nr:hypothetical protein B0H14DRAFT_2647749 [Mycena olivaceomarginata]
MAPSKKRKKAASGSESEPPPPSKKARGHPRKYAAAPVELASRPNSHSRFLVPPPAQVLPATTIEGIASEFSSPVDEPDVQAATALLALIAREIQKRTKKCPMASIIGRRRSKTRTKNRRKRRSRRKRKRKTKRKRKRRKRRRRKRRRAAFKLEFLVPVDAATDTLTVSTDSTDTELFREIADGMDVGVKKLQIAYRFNFWAKTDKPRLLNASKHVKELFDAAHTEMEERNEAKHKNSKSKRKPALQVIISDLRPKQELAKVGKGKGKGKKVTRVSSDSEDEGDAGPKKKSGPSFAEGVHDSITTPPQALKLNVGEGSKAAPVSRRAKDVPPPPQPYAPYYPPPPGYPHGYPPYYPPPPPPAPAPPPPAPVLAASSAPEKPARMRTLRHGISLDSQIGDWLLELAEKDEDGHNFLSFGPLLRAQGLMQVSQLVDKTSESLKQYCPDILPGTAKLLIKRAKKECRRVRKVEAQ